MMRQMNPESLKGMASLLRQYGRNGDTMLAHINPREAMLLDRVSGGGSMNPMTGMPEFFDEEDGFSFGEDGGINAEDQEDQEAEADAAAAGASQTDGEMDDFAPSTGGINSPSVLGGAYADEFAMSMSPASGLGAIGDSGELDSSLTDEDFTNGTRTAADMGIGTLASQVMPDKPGIREILTAPFEVLVNALTLGLVDLELTGKDVTGVPGMTSSDLSRGMAGIAGPQPVGVEFGVPGIGTVGIGKDGVNAYGGPVTSTLADVFGLGLPEEGLPPNAEQMAQERMEAAKAVADERALSAGPSLLSPTPAFYSSPPTTLGKEVEAELAVPGLAGYAQGGAVPGFANGGYIDDVDDADEGDGGDAGGGVGGIGQDPGGNPEEGDDDEAGGGMGIAEIGKDPNASAAGEALGNAAIMGTFNPEFEAKAQAAYGLPVDRDITVSYDGGIPGIIGRKLGRFVTDFVKNPVRSTIDTAISSTPPGKAVQGVTAALTGKSAANQIADLLGLPSEVDPLSQTVGQVARDIFGKDVGEFDPLSETSVVGTQFGINPAFLNYFEGSQDDPRNTPKYAQGGPVSLGSLYNNVRARRGPITGGQRSGGGIMSLR